MNKYLQPSTLMTSASQEKSINILNAWAQIEEFNTPEIPKKKDRLRVPATAEEWRDLSSRHKTSSKNVLIYTCYLYTVPIKQIIEEFNAALKFADTDKTEAIEGETFVVAFRIYEDGSPIKDAFFVPPAFEKIQQQKSKKVFKPIGEVVAHWYQALFHGKEKTITLNKGTREKPSLFEIKTSAEKFFQSDFSVFEKVITEASPAVFSKQKITCLAFLESHELNLSKINHAKIQALPLHSHCLGDLSLAIKQVAESKHSEPLKRFLQEDFSFKKMDLLADPQKMFNVCDPMNIPAGRWPTDTTHSLYLAQQAAVNISIRDLADSEGIIAINGPPGTGKTTLLREIIADIVVKRALRIAALPSPDDLFKPAKRAGLTIEYFPFTTGFSSSNDAIVITSTNNTAVENISKELPEKTSIHEDFFSPEGYFSKEAESLFLEFKDAKECWGAISAPLGKKDNCRNFTTGFWVNGLCPLLEKNKDAKQERETAFFKAKESFQKTFLEFETLRDSLQELKESFQKLDQIREEEKELSARVEKINNSVLFRKDALSDLMIDLEETKDNFENITREHAHIKGGKPNKFSFRPFFKNPFKNFPSPEYKKWGKSLDLAEVRLSTTACRKGELERNLRLENIYLEKELRAQKKLTTLLEKIKEKQSTLEKRQSDLMRIHDDMELDLQFEQKTLAEKNLVQPWKSPTLNYIRSQLFIKALDLHKATIFYHRDKFVANLKIATKIIQGTWRTDFNNVESYKQLWASIFFVVPVVSTTLAAFERLFSDLDCSKCIGWVLIDEAGQVSPQLAVGALLRAKRAIIIGDPMQIEPIRKSSRQLINNILVKNNVSIENFSPHENSVQTIADRTSKLGTWIKQKQKKIWTGIPLRVHRRCRNPMFKISNEIAYSRQMVQGRGQISPVSSWLGESGWYDIQGTTQKGKHGIQEEFDLLKKLLLSEKRNLPCFVITPFLSIKISLENLIFSNKIKGVKPGTIHTFQGSEAHVVFLVLGGSLESEGALTWASQTPNLLNTAVTRSRNFLYVIGNRERWWKQEYFSVLGSELKTLEYEERLSLI